LVTVIATDKTGALTENRMDVRSIDGPDQGRALAATVLANDADLSTGAGDPLDLGLLRYAAANGVDVAQLRRKRPVVSDRPFDSAWKFARVTVRENGGLIERGKVLRRQRPEDDVRLPWLCNGADHDLAVRHFGQHSPAERLHFRHQLAWTAPLVGRGTEQDLACPDDGSRHRRSLQIHHLCGGKCQDSGRRHMDVVTFCNVV
jgi:hypothetical protein